MAGIELNHVPYKGSGPAMQDLLGGLGKYSFLRGIPNVLPHVKAGRLRALAVSTPQRSPDLPSADGGGSRRAGLPGDPVAEPRRAGRNSGRHRPAHYAETARALQDAETAAGTFAQQALRRAR